MSKLDEICGSAIRASAIRLVISEAAGKGEPLNIANIGLACKRFGPTFDDLGKDELAAAVAELQPEPELTAEAAGDAEAAAFNRHRERQRAPLIAPEADAAMTADEWAVAMHAVEQELVVARQTVIEAGQTQRATRGAVSAAVLAWQSGGVQMTREQLQREYIASEQARKMAGVPHGRTETTPGPSVIDLGRAGHGRNANRRYQPMRRGLIGAPAGQRAYTLEQSAQISGSRVVNTGKLPNSVDGNGGE